MARKVRVCEVVPYTLSDGERQTLKDAEAMSEIFEAANEQILATLTTPEERDRSTLDFFARANELAVQRGYKEYTLSFMECASRIRHRQMVFEQGQREMLYRMVQANTSSPKRHRQQKVNGWNLNSRFEIDVWRGVYRFVLRSRGCYDPTLSFKELRSKYPLNSEDLDATVALTRWITCPSSHNWEPMFPSLILATIMALVAPGTPYPGQFDFKG